MDVSVTSEIFTFNCTFELFSLYALNKETVHGRQKKDLQVQNMFHAFSMEYSGRRLKIPLG